MDTNITMLKDWETIKEDMTVSHMCMHPHTSNQMRGQQKKIVIENELSNFGYKGEHRGYDRKKIIGTI